VDGRTEISEGPDVLLDDALERASSGRFTGAGRGEGEGEQGEKMRVSHSGQYSERQLDDSRMEAGDFYGPRGLAV